MNAWQAQQQYRICTHNLSQHSTPVQCIAQETGRDVCCCRKREQVLQHVRCCAFAVAGLVEQSFQGACINTKACVHDSRWFCEFSGPAKCCRASFADTCVLLLLSVSLSWMI